MQPRAPIPPPNVTSFETGVKMASIECECGERIELNHDAGEINCPSCGKRYTMSVSAAEGSDTAKGNSSKPEIRNTPLSATMMQDLPAVTQFERPHGESIVEMASRLAPAVAAAGAMGVADPSQDMPAQGEQPRRNFFSSQPYHLTPGQRNDDDTVPNASAQTELNTGLRLLDRYEVQRKIGQGGMSTVYEAYDEVRGENVALKVLLPTLAANPVLQERFLQEGRLSSNFSHPNIARVYDLHQTPNGVFLSMELLQGSTLRHDMNRRHDQRQSFKPTEVLQLMEKICAALEVVHAEEVIHRDLKPENLWLGIDGSLKVMDFGIAREAARTAYTSGGRGSGTPYYIAPEQLAASPTIDGRADQYSVAIMMYELLTGELPQGAFVAPHEKNPEIPKKMSQAIFRALDADPANRFDNMQEFYEAAQFDAPKPLKFKVLNMLAQLSLIALGAFVFFRWGIPLLESKDIPVWATVGPKTVVEKNELKFNLRNPQTSELEGKLTYRLLSDAPIGAVIDASSGEFSWTPTEAQGPGEYSFTVMAVTEEDGDSPMIEERELQISVTENIDLPVISKPKTIDAKEHEPLVVSIEATDENVPQIGLRYELQSPPSGMSIDSRTGELTWTPSEKLGGNTVQVPLRVYLEGDDNDSKYSESMVRFRVDETIDAPVVTSPDRIHGVVDQPSNFRVTVLDSNVPEIDDYFRLKGGDKIGMSVDPRTGEIFWTPTAQQMEEDLEVILQVVLDQGQKSEVLSEQLITVSASGSIDEDQLGSTEDTPPLISDTIGGGGFGGGSGGVIVQRPTGSNHGTGHGSAPVHGSPFPSNNKPNRPGGGNNRPGGSNNRPNNGQGGRQDRDEKIKQIVDLVKKYKEKKKQKDLQDLINSGGHLRDKLKQTSGQQAKPSTRPFPVQGIQLQDLKRKTQNKSGWSTLQKKSSSSSSNQSTTNRSNSRGTSASKSNNSWSRVNNNVQQWSSRNRSSNSRSQSSQSNSRNKSRNGQNNNSKSSSDKWKDLKQLQSSFRNR